MPPDGLIVQVVEQVEGVLEEGRRALPQAPGRPSAHIQQVQEGPVALRGGASACMSNQYRAFKC